MASSYVRRWLFASLAVLTVLLTVIVIVIRWNSPTVPASGTIPWPDNEPIWMTRYSEFKTDSAKGGYDVVCLGDSLTWGWDDHRDVWAERVTRRPTAFHAIGGETTNGLLWRIDHGELEGLNPKLVVLLIGTNNRWVKDDPADIAVGIEAVIGRVRTNLPTAKVLVLALLPQGREVNNSSRRVFGDVNRRLATLDGSAVSVRDVGGVLLEPDGTLSEAISPDATHLSRTGYVRMADALAPLVRECVGD